MTNTRITLMLIITLIGLMPCAAVGGERGMHLALGAMALTNSTSQGGQGPSGSTILTQTELTYHGEWWGAGTFFQYDRQGSNQTDTALGPKLELHHGPFYLEGGYALLMQRAFTDRSIAKQTGSAWVLGMGVRFMLSATPGGTGGGPGFFLQFTYKYRIQSIKKQDEAELSEPITQKDGYPLFGIGLLF